MVSFGNVKWLVQFTSANLYRGGRRGVWFRVLCGGRHTRSTFRDEDSLSDKGNLCDYVDRAWCYSFLARRAKIQLSFDICKFFFSIRPELCILKQKIPR